MKLIIDIHEDCLEELKNIELNESNEGVVFHTICCVRNGTPLEEELEKIKAEIEKLEYDDFDCNLVLPAWKVYDIIDNHIEELKEPEDYPIEERNCECCVNHTEEGCKVWDCHFESAY